MATDPKQDAMQAFRLISLLYNPQPVLIYKPQKAGNGQALKIDLRLEPDFKVSDTGATFIEKNKRQGLFLEIVPQSGSNGEGFATFGWNDPTLVRTKLGLPDISKMLVSIERYRRLGLDVLPAWQARGKEGPQANVLGSFHKFGAGSTTITYTFLPEAGQLRVSKQAVKGGPVTSRSIQLDLAEEVLFEEVLRQALTGFVRTGLR